jgi:HK97 gp10 family phage protein
MGHYSIDRAAVAGLGAHPPIDAAVHGCASDIYDDSQALVPQPGQADDPYATGELKASGFVDGRASEYTIGYGTDHAGFVEFGTRYMDAEPFLTPAAVRQRGRL